MIRDTTSVRIIAGSIGQAGAYAALLRQHGWQGPISYAEPGPHDPAALPCDVADLEGEVAA